MLYNTLQMIIILFIFKPESQNKKRRDKTLKNHQLEKYPKQTSAFILQRKC